MGKSSFILRLCKGKFVGNLSSTLGENGNNISWETNFQQGTNSFNFSRLLNNWYIVCQRCRFSHEDSWGGWSRGGAPTVGHGRSGEVSKSNNQSVTVHYVIQRKLTNMLIHFLQVSEYCEVVLQASRRCYSVVWLHVWAVVCQRPWLDCRCWGQWRHLTDWPELSERINIILYKNSRCFDLKTFRKVRKRRFQSW